MVILLIHYTISIHTNSYRFHLFTFRPVLPSVPSVSNHQALPPSRLPRPQLTVKMDQIQQQTKRYEDATQIFIFSGYTVVVNARF